ncbi:putative coil containing protein [Vibrio phage 199E37-1]|nr:putative coil containing protein [Vibrio phage 199E37-1]
MSDIKAKLVFVTGLHCDAALVEIESNGEQMVSDDIYDCGVYDWIAYNLEIEIPKCSIMTINVDVSPSLWGGDIDEVNYSVIGNVDVKPLTKLQSEG